MPVGVDVGGTAVKFGRVAAGGVVARARRSAPNDYPGLLDAIRDGVAELGGPDGAAVGVAVPGVVAPDRRSVLDAPNLPFLAGRPLAADLEHALGATVVLENDATAAAQGELWLGGGRGRRDFLLATLGTGVGGGLVLGGRPWRGPGGMAGEFGHLPVGHGRPCHCGAIGCLEAVASAAAMERLGREEFGELLPLPELAARARADDQAARRVFAVAGRALGEAFAQVALLLDLRTLLVGGGGAPALDLLRPHVLERLGERAFGRTPDDFTVVPAELGNDAGLAGAARLAAEVSSPSAE